MSFVQKNGINPVPPFRVDVAGFATLYSAPVKWRGNVRFYSTRRRPGCPTQIYKFGNCGRLQEFCIGRGKCGGCSASLRPPGARPPDLLVGARRRRCCRLPSPWQSSLARQSKPFDKGRRGSQPPGFFCFCQLRRGSGERLQIATRILGGHSEPFFSPHVYRWQRLATEACMQASVRFGR